MRTTEMITKTLTAAVSAGGTITFDYPDGRSASDYAGGTESWLYSVSKGPIYQSNGGISISLGASNITVTLASSYAFPDGDTCYLNLDIGPKSEVGLPATSMTVLTPVKINLGAPIAADANGAVESQACVAATGLAAGINGVLATDGVATFDVPRNVVAAWTTAAVLTITGTDQYGNVIVESSGSGTSMAGKKAFKTITDVSSSANITGLTVGAGDVLGLPVFLPDATNVIAELEDAAAASAGAIVKGDTATATATTGDVRGTYDPNSACDGSAVFELFMLVRDPGSLGVSQYGG